MILEIKFTTPDHTVNKAIRHLHVIDKVVKVDMVLIILLDHVSVKSFEPVTQTSNTAGNGIPFDDFEILSLIKHIV